MRSFLLFVCILSVTSSANAQLFSKKFTEGCYYDTLGIKTCGFIAWSKPDHIGRDTGDHIYYKINNDGSKFKLNTKGISSFIMGADSFVISKNPSLYYAPILRVLLNNRIKLYRWDAEVMSWGQVALSAVGGAVGGAVAGSAAASGAAIAGMGGLTGAYLAGLDKNHLFLITGKNFIDIMSRILANKPEIVKEITDKKLRYRDINDILEYYKTGKKPEKKIASDDYY